MEIPFSLSFWLSFSVTANDEAKKSVETCIFGLFLYIKSIIKLAIMIALYKIMIYNEKRYRF
jgi:hypothetical protein